MRLLFFIEEGSHFIKIMFRNIYSHSQILWLIALSIAVYIQVYDFKFIQYDDPAYVSENSYVKEGLTSDGIKWAFSTKDSEQNLKYEGVSNIYHPLTWLSHMSDVQLFGLAPGWHHIVNVILHTIGAVFGFLFIRKLTSSGNIAFIASALFLIHPTHVESVAWISERKDVLSGVFFWASLYYSINRSKHSSSLAYLCLVLGLLSKPSIVVLPLIVILIHCFRSKEVFATKNLLKTILNYKYWLLTALVFGLFTFYLQNTGTHQQFAAQSSIISRFPHIGLGYWFYLYRAVIPTDLSFSYPTPDYNRALVVSSYLALIVLFYIIWIVRNRMPSLFLAFAWFTICWLPISGVLYIGVEYTPDRYLYISLGGFFILFAQYLNSSAWRKFIAIAVVFLFSALSYSQVKVWSDTESLFVHATKTQPKNYIGWTNLGAFYQTKKQLKNAIECHKKAIELNSSAYISEYNLAICYAHLKNYPLASKHLEKSLKIAPHYSPSLKLQNLLPTGH